MTAYSSVRIATFEHRDLAAMSRHAAGDDDRSRSRRRDDATEVRSVAMRRTGGALRPPVNQPLGEDPNYPLAFRMWKEGEGVAQRSGCPIGIHAVCVVSSSAIEGDPHDPDNPAVRKLLLDSVAWVEDEYGKGCAWAARYDVDERGAGVADVLASPHYEYRIGRSKPKDRIAVSSMLKQSAKRRNQVKSYSAAQDGYNEFMRKRGWGVERGRPLAETNREHLTPEVYGETLDIIRAEHDAREAELDGKQLAVDKQSDLLLAADKELEAKRESIKRRERDLAQAEAEFAMRQNGLVEEVLRRSKAERDLRDYKRRVEPILEKAKRIIEAQESERKARWAKEAEDEAAQLQAFERQRTVEREEDDARSLLSKLAAKRRKRGSPANVPPQGKERGGRAGR